MKLFTVLMALFILTQADAKQKYYKWVDVDGNITYSEKKPPNKQVEELHIVTHDPEPSIEDKKTDNSTEENQEKTPEQIAADEYNEAERLKVQKVEDGLNCKIAKENRKTLEQTMNIKIKDPLSGEIIYMDNTAKKEKLTEQIKIIKRLCK